MPVATTITTSMGITTTTRMTTVTGMATTTRSTIISITHHDASCETCAHLPAPSELQGDWSWRRAFALAFAVGIRPCTGAILVLVFAIGQGLWWAGVFSTLAMALGTAITVSALAAMAVGFRELAARLAGGEASKWPGRVQLAAGLGGASLVLVLGVAFFVGSLGNIQPF